MPAPSPVTAERADGEPAVGQWWRRQARSVCAQLHARAHLGAGCTAVECRAHIASSHAGWARLGRAKKNIKWRRHCGSEGATCSERGVRNRISAASPPVSAPHASFCTVFSMHKSHVSDTCERNCTQPHVVRVAPVQRAIRVAARSARMRCTFSSGRPDAVLSEGVAITQQQHDSVCACGAVEPFRFAG